MSTNRRRFLETAAANAAAFAIMPSAALAATGRTTEPHGSNNSFIEWDLTWPDRLKGKRSAVFDCTEPDSGDGPWRAHMWTSQNINLMKAAPGDIAPVIVLRHHAIILAMQQSFWDKYKTGASNKVMDPVTGKPTDQNPVLISPKEGAPAATADASLPAQLAAGTIVLACAMALQKCVSTIADADKVPHGEAEKRAIAYLIPGVILQPSGVFAVIRAQEAGASYIIAS